MKEASLAGRLAHPHIVSIFEAVVRDDDGYVAMEYVPGGNLLRYTKSDALLPVNDVVQIGFKSCSALDYAFRQGIVHRDIKPANILIADGTNIKVADFGSALLRAVDLPQEDRISRHAELHVPGAGFGQGADTVQRHVCDGRGALRAVDRPGAVCREHRGGIVPQDRAGRARAAERRAQLGSIQRWTRSS